MYIKPGKTFNLSKQSKRFMATIVDPVARHEYKRAMIQAQLASEVIIKSVKKDKTTFGGSVTNQD